LRELRRNSSQRSAEWAVSTQLTALTGMIDYLDGVKQKQQQRNEFYLLELLMAAP
jgi:hypothetical protein